MPAHHALAAVSVGRGLPTDEVTVIECIMSDPYENEITIRVRDVRSRRHRVSKTLTNRSQRSNSGDLMYTEKNFRSKKELKLAVEAYNKFATNPELSGGTLKPVRYYQPGPFGGNEPKDGTFCCEGPHYPEPHRWYATCTAKDGVIVKVK